MSWYIFGQNCLIFKLWAANFKIKTVYTWFKPLIQDQVFTLIDLNKLTFVGPTEIKMSHLQSISILLSFNHHFCMHMFLLSLLCFISVKTVIVRFCAIIDGKHMWTRLKNKRLEYCWNIESEISSKTLQLVRQSTVVRELSKAVRELSKAVMIQYNQKEWA